MDVRTNLDPLPVAVDLGALRATFPQFGPDGTRHKLMPVTATGGPQTAARVTGTVLPSLHLRHTALPFVPPLERTAFFCRLCWVTRCLSRESEEGTVASAAGPSSPLALLRGFSPLKKIKVERLV